MLSSGPSVEGEIQWADKRQVSDAPDGYYHQLEKATGTAKITSAMKRIAKRQDVTASTTVSKPKRKKAAPKRKAKKTLSKEQTAEDAYLEECGRSEWEGMRQSHNAFSSPIILPTLQAKAAPKKTPSYDGGVERGTIGSSDTYWYGMFVRPFHRASMPDGYWTSQDEIITKAVDGVKFDAIAYSRELTRDEMKNFHLKYIPSPHWRGSKNEATLLAQELAVEIGEDADVINEPRDIAMSVGYALDEKGWFYDRDWLAEQVYAYIILATVRQMNTDIDNAIYEVNSEGATATPDVDAKLDALGTLLGDEYLNSHIGRDKSSQHDAYQRHMLEWEQAKAKDRERSKNRAANRAKTEAQRHLQQYNETGDIRHLAAIRDMSYSRNADKERAAASVASTYAQSVVPGIRSGEEDRVLAAGAVGELDEAKIASYYLENRADMNKIPTEISRFITAPKKARAEVIEEEIYTAPKQSDADLGDVIAKAIANALAGI